MSYGRIGIKRMNLFFSPTISQKCLLSSVKSAKVMANSIMDYLTIIFAILGTKHTSVTVFSASWASILLVFCRRTSTQVFNTIVRWITIDVVNVIWQLTKMIQVNKSMSKVSNAIDSHYHITIFSNTASDISGPSPSLLLTPNKIAITIIKKMNKLYLSNHTTTYRSAY